MKEIIYAKYYVISFYDLHLEFKNKFDIVVPANAKNKTESNSL